MIAAPAPTLLFSAVGGVPPGGTGGQAGVLDAATLALPVLIVEDEAMIAWMLESLFEDLGFTAIAIAATGEDAVAQAARLQPGLVVSDINLGPNGMDGVDAAALIHRASAAPVVFITAHAGDDARGRIARDVPGALVLRKPVQAGELRDAVVRATARRDPN